MLGTCKRIYPRVWLAFGAAAAIISVSFAAEPERLQFGRTPTAAEIAAWNIDVTPNGAGLPAGKGSVSRGQVVYAQSCAPCHGATGVEGPRNRLVGGVGTLNTANPIKTVGSYWPYATTVFDYINRAMPFTAPGSLPPDDVYSVVAWLLNRNGMLASDATLDRDSLPQVKMPNRNGFEPEDAFAPGQQASIRSR